MPTFSFATSELQILGLVDKVGSQISCAVIHMWTPPMARAVFVDVPPAIRFVLSWNFSIMIPLTGEGEFHEEVEVFRSADRLHPAPGG